MLEPFYDQISILEDNYNIGFYFAAIPALLIAFRLFRRLTPETAPLVGLGVGPG